MLHFTDRMIWGGRGSTTSRRIYIYMYIYIYLRPPSAALILSRYPGVHRGGGAGVEVPCWTFRVGGAGVEVRGQRCRLDAASRVFNSRRPLGALLELSWTAPGRPWNHPKMVFHRSRAPHDAFRYHFRPSKGNKNRGQKRSKLSSHRDWS